MRNRPKPVSVIIVAVLVIGIIPVKRRVLGSWSVKVMTESGESLDAWPVGERWHDYTFGDDGDSEGHTTHDGTFVFPEVARWRPIAYLAARAVSSALSQGAHYSRGVAGSVGAQFKTVYITQSGMNCFDSDCRAEKLKADLVVL